MTVNAVKKGKMGKRVARRATGKITGRPPTAILDLATFAGEIFYFESYWGSLPIMPFIASIFIYIKGLTPRLVISAYLW